MDANRAICPCGSGLPVFEGACPVCYRGSGVPAAGVYGSLSQALDVAEATATGSGVLAALADAQREVAALRRDNQRLNGELLAAHTKCQRLEVLLDVRTETLRSRDKQLELAHKVAQELAVANVALAVRRSLGGVAVSIAVHAGDGDRITYSAVAMRSLAERYQAEGDGLQAVVSRLVATVGAAP